MSALGWAGTHGGPRCSLRRVRMMRAFTSEALKVSNNGVGGEGGMEGKSLMERREQTRETDGGEELLK